MTERTLTEGALVLEGGSLRSLFTSGVLDLFLEEGIRLSYVNGVSAGAMCGLNYLAGQKGRMLQMNREYLRDKRYISFRNLITKRLIFNFDFIFGELSHTLIPFDYETFEQSSQKFEVVATRCRTGRPEFLSKDNCSDMMAACQASASIPILSRMVKLDGKNYLDGGISLPIAYQRALDLGYEKVVVILTRDHGYRKNPIDRMKKYAQKRYFKPLPKLQEALAQVPERYNRMQEEMDRLEAEGKIFIIRPQFPVQVSRVEQDIRKLEALYEEGRRVAEEALPELKQYLGISETEEKTEGKSEAKEHEKHE